jgi:hypothetical protein
LLTFLDCKLGPDLGHFQEFFALGFADGFVSPTQTFAGVGKSPDRMIGGKPVGA